MGCAVSKERACSSSGGSSCATSTPDLNRGKRTCEGTSTKARNRLSPTSAKRTSTSGQEDDGGDENGLSPDVVNASDTTASTTPGSATVETDGALCELKASQECHHHETISPAASSAFESPSPCSSSTRPVLFISSGVGSTSDCCRHNPTACTAHKDKNKNKNKNNKCACSSNNNNKQQITLRSCPPHCGGCAGGLGGGNKSHSDNSDSSASNNAAFYEGAQYGSPIHHGLSPAARRQRGKLRAGPARGEGMAGQANCQKTTAGAESKRVGGGRGGENENEADSAAIPDHNQNEKKSKAVATEDEEVDEDDMPETEDEEESENADADAAAINRDLLDSDEEGEESEEDPANSDSYSHHNNHHLYHRLWLGGKWNPFPHLSRFLFLGDRCGSTSNSSSTPSVSLCCHHYHECSRNSNASSILCPPTSSAANGVHNSVLVVGGEERIGETSRRKKAYSCMYAGGGVGAFIVSSSLPVGGGNGSGGGVNSFCCGSFGGGESQRFFSCLSMTIMPPAAATTNNGVGTTVLPPSSLSSFSCGRGARKSACAPLPSVCASSTAAADKASSSSVARRVELTGADNADADASTQAIMLVLAAQQQQQDGEDEDGSGDGGEGCGDNGNNKNSNNTKLHAQLAALLSGAEVVGYCRPTETGTENDIIEHKQRTDRKKDGADITEEVEKANAGGEKGKKDVNLERRRRRNSLVSFCVNPDTVELYNESTAEREQGAVLRMTAPPPPPITCPTTEDAHCEGDTVHLALRIAPGAFTPAAAQATSLSLSSATSGGSANSERNKKMLIRTTPRTTYHKHPSSLFSIAKAYWEEKYANGASAVRQPEEHKARTAGSLLVPRPLGNAYALVVDPHTTSYDAASASRYVAARLAMGRGSFDMAAFRVGVDTCDVFKRPKLVVFSEKEAKQLLLASHQNTQMNTEGGDYHGVSGGSSFTSSSTASLGELTSNSMSTWDLLQSIPNAIERVNDGDLLYRFCARKFADLTLEDRTVLASFINVSGFEDELVENDQPILDFIFNKNHTTTTAATTTTTKEGSPSPSSSSFVLKNNDASDLLIVMVRLVGVLPFVNSRDVNVDCILNDDYQKAMAAPDETLEKTDRYRTSRKVKNVIPFVFSFRFQITGSEIADDETLEEYTQHHDAKPTRIVVMERTRKHRGEFDGTVKNKGFNIYYDIPPRGISSITGKPLSQKAIAEQNKQYDALSPHQRATAEERERLLKAVHAKQYPKSASHHQRNAETPSHSLASPSHHAGVLVDHTAIIIRTSIPRAVASAAEMVGNRVAQQTCDQIMNTRQFLVKQKLRSLPSPHPSKQNSEDSEAFHRGLHVKQGQTDGAKSKKKKTDGEDEKPWSPMVCGGDNPHARFLWER